MKNKVSFIRSASIDRFNLKKNLSSNSKHFKPVYCSKNEDKYQVEM